MEEYRIWINEKSIDDKDSVYHESKTFKAFDSNDRLINEGNCKFYFYKGETDQIAKTTSVLVRDRNVMIYSEQYNYNKQGLLQNILRIGESIDTIKSFKYNENGKLTELKTGYRKMIQEFEDGFLKKRTMIESDNQPRISEFEYDTLKRPIFENWVFSGNHKMKTQFEYYDNGNLFRETDSTYIQDGNPNQYIEFMNEYYYDQNDSISEIIQLGKIRGELTFKVRGRIIFERNLEIKN